MAINPGETPRNPVAIWGKAKVESGSKYVCSWHFFRKEPDGTGYEKKTEAGEVADLIESGGDSTTRSALNTLFKDKLDYKWIQSSYGTKPFKEMVKEWESGTAFYNKKWNTG